MMSILSERFPQMLGFSIVADVFFFFFFFNHNDNTELAEMAQWFTALAALPEDWSLGLNPHAGQFTTS
jgi:hypothetical protein